MTLKFASAPSILPAIAVLLLFQLCVTDGGWVDPDSQNVVTTSMIDGTQYSLVMSDEFEAKGRGFADGEDRCVKGR